MIAGTSEGALPDFEEAARPQILVVDDETAYAQCLALAFEDEGLAAEAVHDGESALVCAAAWTPDLIVLDVRMPGMDGLEVLRRLRSRRESSRTPVILITGEPGQHVDVAAVLQGFCQVVRKPVDSGAVVRLARETLAGPFGISAPQA